MRIVIAGDTHSDVDWMKSVTRIAGRADAHWILQVGDFGWWPRMITSGGWPRTDHILGTLSRACDRAHVNGWIFLDGNHDDHESLAEAETSPLEGVGMLARLGDHVWYSPRGNTFDLDRIRFGTLGGAVSIDAYVEAYGFDFGSPPYRPGWDWFPALEAPTQADVSLLIDQGPIDVLLSHEAPAGVGGLKPGLEGLPITADIQQRTDAVRRLVLDAVLGCRPRLVVHGHWHQRYGETLEYSRLGETERCRVEGLAHNGMNGGRDGRAFIALDLPDLTVIDGYRL